MNQQNSPHQFHANFGGISTILVAVFLISCVATARSTTTPTTAQASGPTSTVPASSQTPAALSPASPESAGVSASLTPPPANPDILAPNAETRIMEFSSFAGGANEDVIRDITTDGQGNIYVTGGTKSPTFPTTNGAYDRSHNGQMDVFVMKLSPAGQILWSTFLGGPNYDRAYSIEVSSQGVTVAGRAGDNFPTTPGVIQPVFGGDANPNTLYGKQDGFVARLSLDGSQLLWSTYFGGNDRSFIRDIDVDASGEIYLAETDVSAANPHITSNAFQTALSGSQEGVIARLNASGSQVLWATYLGGSGAHDVGTPSIRVDKQGNAFVLGITSSPDLATTNGAYDRHLDGRSDLHLAKFSGSGAFIFGTYIGGSGIEFSETHGLALDNQGNPVIAATTTSNNFPVTPGTFQTSYGGSGGANTGANTNYPGDGFVAKISANGSQLLAATYLGGNLGEGIEGVSLDAQNNVYVSGATYSNNFPVTLGAFQTQKNGGADYFAVKLSPNLGQELYGTFIGGSATDYARTSISDGAGNFYVAGETDSSNWPVKNPFQVNFGGALDAVVLRFDSPGSSTPPTATPTPTQRPGATATPRPSPTPGPSPTPVSSDQNPIYLPVLKN